jgi:hypothetical protein
MLLPHKLLFLPIICAWLSLFYSPAEASEDWGDSLVRLIDTYQVELEDGDFQSHLVQSSELININVARSTFGYRGNGYSVAVLDTGVDYSHPALGGGWGNKVIAGWDFFNNDGDPMDDNGHGTHVAGIIAGDHDTYKGIAPEANIVALKVLGSDGWGTFSMVLRALEWVIDNHETYNIVSVNMSLGSGSYNVNPSTYLEDILQLLKERGITVVAASGNAFYDFNSVPGLAYPAISPRTVSVGAVYDASVGPILWAGGAIDFSTEADRITSFTQRSAHLDLMAPGALLTSTIRNGQWGTFGGTSMAAPLVAGAVLLAREMLESLGQSEIASPDEIISLLKATASVVTDGDDENDNVENTMLSFPRIEMLNLFSEIAKNYGSDKTQEPDDDNQEPGENDNNQNENEQPEDENPSDNTPEQEFWIPTDRQKLVQQLVEVKLIVKELRKNKKHHEQTILRQRLDEFSDALKMSLQARHFKGKTARLARLMNKALKQAGRANKKVFKEHKKAATRAVKRLDNLLRQVK